MSLPDLTSTELLRILAGVTGIESSVVATVNKWGQNADIDTLDTNQVIWPIKKTVQDYLFLDAAIAFTLQSSSALDTSAGTGANTVSVQYHDFSGEQKTVTLALDGVTPVALPEDSLGVFRMSVETTGSTNGNAGTITVEDGSSNIYAVISIGEGQTQQAVQRIPSKIGDTPVRKATIKKIIAGYGRAANNNSAVMRLHVRKADGTVLTKADPVISTLSPNYIREYTIGGIAVYPGEHVYWKAVSVSANDTPVRAEFDIVYE